MYDLKAYTIPLDDLDLSRVLKTWNWLTGGNKTVIALTKLGDILLKDNQDRLFFLDTGKGKIEIIHEHYLDFVNGKLSNNVYEEILLTILVDKLRSNGKTLKSNQVYSFYKLPVIGGRYIVENIFPLDLYKHYGVTGEINLQLRDLPGGTKIEFKTRP
jgi:hypothetical protein